MTLHLLLVRHGESENNVLFQELNRDSEVFQMTRSHDAPLTKRGMEQAELAASGVLCLEKSKAIPPVSMVLSSYLTRALDTAAVVSDLLNRERNGAKIPNQVWCGLHEAGGSFAFVDYKANVTKGVKGNTNNDVRQRHPHFELPDDIEEETGWWPHDRRETKEEEVQRAKDMKQRLSQLALQPEHEGSTAVVITHGAFYSTFMSEVFGYKRTVGPEERISGVCEDYFDGHEPYRLHNTGFTLIRVANESQSPGGVGSEEGEEPGVTDSSNQGSEDRGVFAYKLEIENSISHLGNMQNVL